MDSIDKINLPNQKSLILFDEECVLCNKTMQIISRSDKSSIFLFDSLKHYKNFKEISDEYIIVITKESKILIRSDAIIYIAKNMSNWIKILSFIAIFPKNFRDFIYNYVARNRYKIFGKTKSCTLNLKTKILHQQNHINIKKN